MRNLLCRTYRCKLTHPKESYEPLHLTECGWYMISRIELSEHIILSPQFLGNQNGLELLEINLMRSIIEYASSGSIETGISYGT